MKEEALGSRLVTTLCPPPPPGETRRILSVQPTYDWTCFSHSLLNVSPMPVESSPPLPCPTPCHLLPNCTSCLASKGADGGWQHCVWSSSLQQVMPVSCCQPWRPPAPALLSFLLPLAISSFPPAVVITTLSLPPDVSPCVLLALIQSPVRHCQRGLGGPSSKRTNEGWRCGWWRWVY